MKFIRGKSKWACLILSVSVFGMISFQSLSVEDKKAEKDSKEKTAGQKETEHDSEKAPKWPRVIDVPKGEVVLYQPQLRSFRKNRLSSVMAVSITTREEKEPVYCAVWLEAKIKTDKVDRTVSLRDLRITNIKLPEKFKKHKKTLAKTIRKNILQANFVLSLDRFQSMLETIDKENEVSKDLKNDPPDIIFTKKPSVLISIDGDPKLKPEGEKLLKVINTPFLIVLDRATSTYYLRWNVYWFSAKKIQGHWKLAESVPPEVNKLLTKKERQKQSDSDHVPKIIVVTKPTELLQCEGEPEFRLLPHTNLMYVANSENDIFLDVDSQKIYVLLAGRWFSAKSKEGPWKYVSSDKLPKTFRKIPHNSEKSYVLSHISGTREAKDAVLATQIPQTATIKRNAKVELNVGYDGEPEFKPIEGTSMFYAENTSFDVVKLNDKYYCCDNGAWYESTTPNGPWIVCTQVPDEIYTIPPSSPLYNTRYVNVYGADDDNVYTGYTSGYDGCYDYGGCVVYGTGYYYRPWYRRHYYPRHCTYGYHPKYNHHYGYWRHAMGYRHGDRFVSWDPNIGNRHLRAQKWWGVGGYRSLNNRDRRTFNHYNRNLHAFREAAERKSRSFSAKRRKSEAREKSRYQKRRRTNNVYVNTDGNIYRRSLNGWEKRSNRSWKHQKHTNATRKTYTNLNRDFYSHRRGTNRYHSRIGYSHNLYSGRSRGASFYRSSGGTFKHSSGSSRRSFSSGIRSIGIRGGRGGRR